jgi:apolipoprotein D and lipocalin family protein
VRRYLAVAATTAMMVLGTGAVASAADAAIAPVTPVANVNLQRYLGRWYQIAAIPLFFERICAEDDTANYTIAADGNVSVANNCTLTTGGDYDVTGEGLVDNAPANSEISVSFIDLFGLHLFPKTPNYDIVGLDPGYRWAVVVSPNRLSAFVLSRTPRLGAAATSATQAILSANGFNPCRLEVTVQDGGASAPVPYCP